MGKPYFRIIQTVNPDEAYARNIQEQKLNNYTLYHQDYTNEEATKYSVAQRVMARELQVPDFEIKHMAQSTTTKDYIFIITTTLCCVDKDEEVGEKY